MVQGHSQSAQNLKEKFGARLSLQLDFTATPKDQNGTFFPWIICDYPLAQAIEDRIVKSPLIIHKTDRADPDKYSKASVAYAEWINIAISRWQEHFDAYSRVGIPQKHLTKTIKYDFQEIGGKIPAIRNMGCNSILLPMTS